MCATIKNKCLDLRWNLHKWCAKNLKPVIWILMEQLDYKNIHLAIIAIEKGAKLMKVPPQNMYMLLKKQGLIHNFLLPYYDELHTQSAEWLAETTVETLKNWEEALPTTT